MRFRSRQKYRRAQRAGAHSFAPTSAAAEALSFPELTARMESLQRDILAIAAHVNSTAARLGDLQRVLRTFVGASYTKRQHLESQYAVLLSSLLGILDYVEALQSSEKAPSKEQLSGVWSRGEQTLQDLGISEIPVVVGDPFTGSYHKQVLKRPSPYPSGRVIEVARRGWWADTGEADSLPVLVRAADVVTSAGPALAEEPRPAPQTAPGASALSLEGASPGAPPLPAELTTPEVGSLPAEETSPTMRAVAAPLLEGTAGDSSGAAGDLSVWQRGLALIGPSPRRVRRQEARGPTSTALVEAVETTESEEAQGETRD